MPSEQGRLPRKLAAILYADVAGYSRLTGQDEDLTHRVLSDYLDLIARVVAEHRGRVMHYAGDAVLAMFEAAIDALSCAVKIQRDLEGRNQTLPEARRVEFRVGVNLGDVIEDRGDIYGDGVNVAARLESLADPGGICVSGIVHEAVVGKVPFEFESLGERQVKNIAHPVHAYRVLVHDIAGRAKPRLGTSRAVARRAAGLAGAAAIVLAVLALVWWRPWAPDFSPASLERMSFPLPENPSIAVVPFKNNSDSGAQDAHADALSEHFIGILQKLPEVFVIAQDSSFNLAQSSVETRQFAEQLGVRYVLTGTVHGASDRLAISLQLGDALQGMHLWSGATNRPADEVFHGLGELAIQMASAIGIRVTPGQRDALLRAPTRSVEAWRLHVQARSEGQVLTRDKMASARDSWSRALERDQTFSVALLSLARTHLRDLWFGWTEDFAMTLHQAETSALRVLEIDPRSAGAYQLLGAVRLYRSDFDKALEYGTKAVSLAPNDADAFALLAISQYFSGQAAEAEKSVDRAIRLNPRYPPWYLLPRAETFRLSGRYEEAIGAVKEELRRIDSVPARIRLALYYSHAGNETQAEAEIKKLLKLAPRMTLASWSQTQKFMEPAQHEDDRAALKRIGMPELLSWECLVRNKCP